MNLRDARPADLSGLAALENEAFATDRLSARSMRRLLSSPSARIRVIPSSGDRGGIDGYCLTLFRRGSAVARLYSLAVAATRRGTGVAAALLADAERMATRHGARALRLEVRHDNARAIRFYMRLGYRRIGVLPAYYADNASALRYEKRLSPGRSAPAAGEEDRSPRRGAVDSLMTRTSSPAAPAERRGAED